MGGKNLSNVPLKEEPINNCNLVTGSLDFIYFRDEKGSLNKRAIGFKGMWVIKSSNLNEISFSDLVRAAVIRFTKSAAEVIYNESKFQNLKKGYIHTLPDIKYATSFLPYGIYDLYPSDAVNICVEKREKNGEIIWIYANKKILREKPGEQRKKLREALNSAPITIKSKSSKPFFKPIQLKRSKPRVLLFNSIEEEKHNRQISLPALFLTSSLKKVGIKSNISIFPIKEYCELLYQSNYSHSNIKELKALENELQKIISRDYDIVGFSLYDSAIPITLAKLFITEFRKKSSSLIAVGGPLPTAVPKTTLAHIPADILIRGEADTAFPKLIKTLYQKEGLIDEDVIGQLQEDINGLWLHVGDIFLINSLHIKNVLTHNELNTISLDFISFHPENLIMNQERFDGISFSTSRGCPRYCTFCSKVHGRRLRQWSAKKIEEELFNFQKVLEGLKSKKVNLVPELYWINIVDDDFLLNPERALEVLRRWRDLSREGKLSLKLNSFQSSLESLLKKHDDGKWAVNKKIIDGIAKAKEIFNRGRILLFIGTDAFEEKEIGRLGKGKYTAEEQIDLEKSKYSFSEVKAVIRALDKAGIINVHFLILTNPWTKNIDLEENLKNVLHLHKRYPTFILSSINPYVILHLSTFIYNYLIREGNNNALNYKHLLTAGDFSEYDLPVGGIAVPIHLSLSEKEIRNITLTLESLKNQSYLNRLFFDLKNLFKKRSNALHKCEEHLEGVAYSQVKFNTRRLRILTYDNEKPIPGRQFKHSFLFEVLKKMFPSRDTKFDASAEN